MTILIVLCAIGAYLAIRAGLAAWRGDSLASGGTKETYWRGRRIEMMPAPNHRRSISTSQRMQAALYLVVGVSLLAVVLVTLGSVVAGG
jgi:hypothetical protein